MRYFMHYSTSCAQKTLTQKSEGPSVAQRAPATRPESPCHAPRGLLPLALKTTGISGAPLASADQRASANCLNEPSMAQGPFDSSEGPHLALRGPLDTSEIPSASVAQRAPFHTQGPLGSLEGPDKRLTGSRLCVAASGSIKQQALLSSMSLR